MTPDPAPSSPKPTTSRAITGDQQMSSGPLPPPPPSSSIPRPTPPPPLPHMPVPVVSQPASGIHPSRTNSPKAPIKSRTPKPSTPRPSTGDAAAPSIQRSPDGRALNVTDALGYLDSVKGQFHEKPEVYNKFLDIMKDFKGQIIDTPGVIQRVSRLFHGNPVLIKGFNTFLPVGYRIDISVDPLDPNMITVTTPSGTTTQTTTNAAQIIRPHPQRDIPGFGPNLAAPFPVVGPPPPPLPPIGSGPASRSMTPQGYHVPQPIIDQAFSPAFHNQNPQTTAAASLLGGLNNRNPVDKQPLGEFTHAIQYLNKIKSRFDDEHNTYKQFLDILQTYQKGPRDTSDTQVYAQVQNLFRDAPDLLVEFKDFLPDSMPAGAAQAGVSILPHPGTPASGTSSQPWNPPDEKKKQQPKRKKRPLEKDPTPIPPPALKVAAAPPPKTKKQKHHHKPDPASPTFSPYAGPPSPPPIAEHNRYATPLPPSLLPLPPSFPFSQLTADKFLFFDRAKRSLEGRDFEEFLKFLQLFSKEIIDLRTLVQRSTVYLGEGDLMSDFKDLVGWDKRQDDVETGPPGSIRTGPPDTIALQVDDGQGPSYRRLPESEIRLACSGRDELCRSVLNDEWVSHPTWASEESGFISHKKNSFEEALHKSEEERHEYQVHLEALTRTIAVLEPLYGRLEDMSNEERASFKLKPDFGGPGKSIYHRIIKKIYGRENGMEVIQAMQDCPAVAVPVVLSRLKNKNEEWRRLQRDWSRTWKEVDSKNFYKSLDHQGITFKANDKKNITAKHFVADIEAIKLQQLEQRESETDALPSFARGSVGHQLEYSFADTSVLHDSLKMVYSFLDRSQAQYSPLERRAVEKFLRQFVPLLCMFPAAEFNAACGPPEGGVGTHAHDIDDVLPSHEGRRATASPYSAHSNGVVAEDLRKKLLRTAQASRNASPSPKLDELDDLWIQETSTASSDQPAHGSGVARPFFANTTFYTLLRHLQLLYSRLLTCKEVGQELADQKHAILLSNPVAVELGLDDPNGPSTVLASLTDNDHAQSSTKANVVYMYLLDACEKVFAGELDQASFEEHMRWFFGNKAYHLFTLDKLITALVKQVQTIISDSKCQELWALLQSARSSETVTNQDNIRYRREGECHVGQDDHLYRVEWADESKTIRVSLMGSEDPSVEEAKTRRDRWRAYKDTYVMRHPTEWVPQSKGQGSAVFLRRMGRPSGDTSEWSSMSEAKSYGRMSIRIGLPSYKIVYESGSEDMIWRARDPVLVERARRRQEEGMNSYF